MDKPIKRKADNLKDKIERLQLSIYKLQQENEKIKILCEKIQEKDALAYQLDEFKKILLNKEKNSKKN